MDNKREYIYRIEPGDADFMKRATLMSLADYILHTAGEDADRGGFGVRDLNLHNASWVLTRMALEVERMPVEYERIRVTTWVSAVTRAMTTRNFEVFDEKGVRIACAVTNWAMLDLSARRMLDLHLLPAYDSMTQDFPLPAALPCRLAPLSGGREYEHAVVYSDLDFNCHANSVKCYPVGGRYAAAGAVAAKALRPDGHQFHSGGALRGAAAHRGGGGSPRFRDTECGGRGRMPYRFPDGVTFGARCCSRTEFCLPENDYFLPESMAGTDFAEQREYGDCDFKT